MLELNQISAIQLNSIKGVKERAEKELKEITGRNCIVNFYIEKAEIEISLEFILATVSEVFNVSVEDIKSKTRKRPVVFARQCYCYLANMHTKVGLKRIGELIGGRDHSTVIHSRAVVLETNMLDSDFRAKLSQVETAIETILANSKHFNN